MKNYLHEPKKKLFVLVLCTIGTTLFSGLSAQKNVIYSNNFDKLPVGRYSQEKLKKEFGVTHCNGCDQGRVFIKKTKYRGKVLEVRYPKNQVRSKKSGMQTRIPFKGNKKYDELYMSYWVYFPKNFNFRAGGKLPGLMYRTDKRDMSLRLMWRKNGLLEFYVHYNTYPTRAGFDESINWSLKDPYSEPKMKPQSDQVRLAKGKWNHIEMYYKLNTPGKANGIMKGWLNGKLAGHIKNNGDFRQKNEKDISMNRLFFSTFFGGKDKEFQPLKDEVAFFDGFVVSKSRIGMKGAKRPSFDNLEDASLEPEIVDHASDRVQVYPNPVQDRLIISNTLDNPSSVKILNILGQLVYTEDMTANQEQVIDLSAMKSGVYTVVITSDTQKIIRKILKN